MLDYENAAFLDVINEDGLLVMAKGLGIENIISSILKIYCDPGNLVLVIGSSASEEVYFINRLEAENVNVIPKSITSEWNNVERSSIYHEGGVLFVTSRILVVDFLKAVVPAELVTGIIVLRAHRVITSCQESFILRLYREKNKAGFIKAFSSSPDSFTRGFCQVERVMRSLFVKKLHLWPRFHVTVNASLENHKPEVVEIEVPLTKPMLAIQTALLDLINVCIQDLKRLNTTLDLDDVTADNAISKAFDKIIRHQLEPAWHELDEKTKQLVNDLKELRAILIRLTQYDCVTFYNIVKSLRSEEKVKHNSGWIFLPAADTLFVQAKLRVFGAPGKSDTKRKGKSDEPALEENPKWLALNEILDEVLEKAKAMEIPAAASTTLVVVNDNHTRDQIKELLRDGSRKLLSELYETCTGATKLSSKVDDSDAESKKKKQKRNGKSSTSNPAPKKEEDSENDIKLKPLTEPLIVIEAFGAEGGQKAILETLKEHTPRVVILYDLEITVIRQLEVYKASSPDIPLIVYLLVYKNSAEEQKYLTALRGEKKAFEMLIEQKGSMVVPEERDGRLDGHPDLDRSARKASETVNSDNFNTRRGGGDERQSKQQQKVIVDMREFRSELPSLLYRLGIDVEPVTLEVGDYILTPDVCVERKSVSDLIGSLNNGRLFNQATAMCRYYKRPILLIEFDPEKPFMLQRKFSASGEVGNSDCMNKLLLTTMHFPRLRIMWCSSPHATAELFREMKIGREQPSSAEAQKVTEAISKELGIDSTIADRYNPASKDFLMLLPGVDQKNVRLLLNHTGSLSTLSSEWTEAKLAELLTNSSAAKTLWKAMHEIQTPRANTKSNFGKTFKNTWKKKPAP